MNFFRNLGSYWLSYAPMPIWHAFHRLAKGINRLLYILGRRERLCSSSVFYRPNDTQTYYESVHCVLSAGHPYFHRTGTQGTQELVWTDAALFHTGGKVGAHDSE